MEMTNTEFYITSDGIRLHAKMAAPSPEGQKCPFVIIAHGFTGDMEEDHIRLTAEALNRHGYATLRIEMYGHGQSEGRFEDHTMLKWVSELIDVIDFAKAQPFAGDLYLMGHSAGGLATVLTGAIRRSSLRAILPLSPAISIVDGAQKGDLFGASFDPGNIPDEVWFPSEAAAGAGLMLKGNYLRVAQLLPVEASARAFRGPVFILHADSDETIPVEYAEKLAEMYENATLKIIKDDTHCYDRHLDEVIGEILRFLDDDRKALQEDRSSC